MSLSYQNQIHFSITFIVLIALPKVKPYIAYDAFRSVPPLLLLVEDGAAYENPDEFEIRMETNQWPRVLL